MGGSFIPSKVTPDDIITSARWDILASFLYSREGEGEAVAAIFIYVNKWNLLVQ